MTRKRTYDFSPQDDGSGDVPQEAPAPVSDPPASSEFFIDGWDAYRRWLDDLRDQLTD